MEKVRFRKVDVKVDRKMREFKILETPTLLKRLYLEGEITTEEFTQGISRYAKAIKAKDELPKDTSSVEKLRDYQQKLVNYAKEFKSFAIFDDPRVGKTPSVISIIKEKGLIDKKIVVMCPGKVTGNWIRAFQQWGNVKAKVYEGGEVKDQIIIMTYSRARLSMYDVMDFEPDVAILDEAHVLRYSKGSRQRLSESQKAIFEEKALYPINISILKIGKMAKHLYALSGTPGVNTAEDTFAILQFIMPNTFDSFWTFAYYFFEIKFNFMGGREIKGYLNDEKIQELQEIFNYCSTNNKQSEVLKWLIPPKKTIVELELTPIQKKLETDLIEQGRIGTDFVLTEIESMIHYNSIVMCPNLLFSKTKISDLGCKFNYIIDYIANNPDKNIALFATRAKVLDLLRMAIESQFPHKTIYEIRGKTKNEESLKIQDKINKKSKKSDIILLGTIGTCKEGISAEGLNVAIALDQSWVPSHMEQIMHRLDATTPEAQEYFGEKEFIILQVPNTIDTIVMDTLVDKKTRTEMINDYKKFIEKRRNKNGFR